jgi:hypothetical protein
MARNKKSILNQVVEEPKKDEVVETEPINVEEALLTPEPEEIEESMTSEEVQAQEEFIFEEVESPVYEDDGEEEGETEIIEVKSRTIESLSHKELRLFQRTGQMPK